MLLSLLADAKTRYGIDPTRVYLTGHSMGGHGTWHLGVHHPGLFAVLGPSAGWSSFMSYGGLQESSGAWGRASAHHDTMDYLSNLSRRAVYVVHGDADNNVPISEGRSLSSKPCKPTRMTSRCMSSQARAIGGMVPSRMALIV